MARFKLTDIQAEAILNMRLRALRKLEEMEIRNEHTKLTQGAEGPARRCWRPKTSSGTRISDEIKAVKEKFSKKTPLGRRRTDFADAPDDRCRSRAGDDREGAGHRRLLREGLDPRPEGPSRGHLDAHLQGWRPGASSSSTRRRPTRSCCSRRRGKFFTLDAAKLPGGRGHGEPVRLMCDLDAADSDRRALRPSAGREAPARLDRGRRLHRARRTNASPTPARASRC